MPVGLILLAAGESRRLGSPKQLLPYRGQPLLRHAALTAMASVCRPVVVVLGAEADRIRSVLDGLDVRIVENPEWPIGMGTSIGAGLRYMEADAVDGVVLAVCDQPMVTAGLIDQLVEAHKESGLPIVACAYGGSLGVPALFDRSLFGELMMLREAGAKRVIEVDPRRVTQVDFPGGTIDIDTPDDVDRHAAG